MFPLCPKCRAPRIVHIETDWKICEASPSENDILEIIDHLEGMPGIDKFGLCEINDDIDRLA